MFRLGSLPLIFGSGAPAMSPIPNPAPGAPATGLMGTLSSGGAPMQAPMPEEKPGLLSRLGNASWWKAIGDNEKLPLALMLAGMNGSAQGGGLSAPPLPSGSLYNPAAIQASLQMMRLVNEREMARGRVPHQRRSPRHRLP